MAPGGAGEGGGGEGGGGEGGGGGGCEGGGSEGGAQSGESMSMLYSISGQRCVTRTDICRGCGETVRSRPTGHMMLMNGPKPQKRHFAPLPAALHPIPPRTPPPGSRQVGSAKHGSDGPAHTGRAPSLGHPTKASAGREEPSSASRSGWRWSR